jgi:PAS domain S-box-containing protein
MEHKDDTTRPPDADDRLEAGAPRRRYRLATPLSLAIALGCIAAVAGLWLVTLQRVAFEREQAVASAMQSNANLAIAFEQQVFRTLKAAEQVAAFVREQYLQQGTDIDLRDWVERGVIREPMFTIISVVNEQGDIVSSSQETGAVNYSDRAFFQALQRSERDELFVSEPVLGRVSGQWRIPMALRIVREGGRFGGVVVMSVDPTNFTDFYRQADLGTQGLLELTGLDGVVRGRKSGGKVSFGADARSLPWFQRQAAAPEDDLIDAHGALDGVPRILSYRSMAGHPLMVTVGSASSEVLEPVMQRRAGYLALAAGASVALLCFGALLIVVLARQRAVADALASSEGLFRATFHQAATGIAHITPEGRILRANDKFCRMLGYSLQELRQRDLFALSDEGEREAVRRFLAQRLVAHSPVLSPEMEKAYRRKDGGLLWVYEALGLVKDAQGRPDFLVVVTQDISARKELEMRLSHDVLHDALTGLSNRCSKRPGATGGTLQCSMWTWTGSSPSTTSGAMQQATCFCSRWHGGWKTACAPKTPWRAWAATSSASCWPPSSGQTTARSWPARCCLRWSSLLCWRGLLRTSRPAWARRSTRAMAPMPMRCSPRPMLRCMRPSRQARTASASTPH